MVLDQLEKDSNDIMNLLKKERAERERDSNLIKERVDNEKKELQVGSKCILLEAGSQEADAKRTPSYSSGLHFSVLHERPDRGVNMF